jgi:hypothetical protein
VEQVIAELKDIIQLFERDLGDSKRVVSFGQVKEIAASIERMKRQGLPVPSELNELKIKLFSEHGRHQERIGLYQKLQESIGELLNRATPGMQKN